MSDWSELCELMKIENDENALDKILDMIIEDERAGSAAHSAKQVTNFVTNKPSTILNPRFPSLDDELPF